ncbi:MAG: hypothetical protein PHH01_02440 [Patescibacteria group bacterium]|nr:hypothetical protein [Patescibacteria group bacterium]
MPIDEIYKKIWEMAKPYYEKGRPMDIEHVDWLIKEAMIVCEKEDIDISLLMPLVILHDVGYAKVPQENPFKLNIRQLHMDEGAKIAKQILDEVDYPEDKKTKVVSYVSVHDNWALGDDHIYHEDKILGVFNDLEYSWMATEKGFPALMKILNKSHSEMLEHLETNEKIKRRPFSTDTTKKLYEGCLKDRYAEQNKN